MPLSPSRLFKLRVASREIAAFARQAWLLRHDVSEPVLPEQLADDDHVVVCLHGLFATAGVLRPMRQRLERNAGVHTATLTYPVGPGIESLAGRLDTMLAELPATVRLHLVGHSLGGVVARYYAQESNDTRVVQTISLGTPFAGVRRVGRLGVHIARDLDPSSQLLRQLLLGSQHSSALPHLSIVAEQDQFVHGPVAQALPGGDVEVIGDCGHNGLLYHQRVAQLVESRVLAAMTGAW